MLLVTTDDPESLRREREHIVAQTRADPNYVPMIAVSSRNQRGKVDLALGKGLLRSLVYKLVYSYSHSHLRLVNIALARIS